MSVLKAIGKLIVAAVTGFEIDEIFEKPDEFWKKVEKEFETLQKELKTLPKADIEEFKYMLIAILAAVLLLFVMLAAEKVYAVVHRNGKKSRQRSALSKLHS